jgi:guanine nucleotide-binding protein subunit alpha, other
MQDAMTIWDSICHSQWFKQTSIVSDVFAVFYLGSRVNPMIQILFLNKDDLFQKKIQHSDIKNFFPVSARHVSGF